MALDQTHIFHWIQKSGFWTVIRLPRPNYIGQGVRFIPRRQLDLIDVVHFSMPHGGRTKLSLG